VYYVEDQFQFLTTDGDDIAAFFGAREKIVRDMVRMWV
jgi:hypothetical protein